MRSKKLPSQRGSSIIELMIGMTVLAVGVLGSAGLMGVAIGANGRNRLQTNSTAMAQMVAEKIGSVPVINNNNLNITDCNNVNNTVAVVGSPAGTGAALLASGDVDFSQVLGGAGAPVNYYMLYSSCGINAPPVIYDVRWRIFTPSANVKLITVSAKSRGLNNDPKYVSQPVTIRFMSGR